MKTIFTTLLLLFSVNLFSQELDLRLFQQLNQSTLNKANELLVGGYGYYLVSENKYLHPKSSIEDNNFLMITLKDISYKNNTKTLRNMEIICSSNLGISSFKSELISNDYIYMGNSKDKDVVDFYTYKKGDDEEINIITLTNNGIKKYQIIFTYRY